MTKSKQPEYRAYHDAKNRCNNGKNPWYGKYGGSGILFLFNSFDEFMEEIGPRPSSSFSLDRVNPYGNYEKGNVRWADKVTQSLNQRVSNKLGITGVEFKKGKFWYAAGKLNNKYYHLYCGSDFFEACCARKSWENKIL